MQLRRWAGYAVCLMGALLVIDAVTDSVAAQQSNGEKARLAAAKNWPEVNRREVPLLYVATPGTAGGGANIGHGILVFDARMNYRFVKRIPFPESWNVPAWQDGNVDEIKGIEVSAETGLIYLSTLTGLSAFDLRTEKLVWKQLTGLNCCDRPSMSDGSKVMYVPNRGGSPQQRGWRVVDAVTGNLIKELFHPQVLGGHNSIMTPDGSRVFLSSTSSRYLAVADTKTHTIVQLVGPFSENIRPFTINGAGTLVFVNTDDVLGFEVGDVKTGKKIHRVEVPGYSWTFERLMGEFTPSHGIAMSPDEAEIWVTDTVHGALHVFDSTKMPPTYKTTVMMTRRGDPDAKFMADGRLRGGDMLDYPYWVTFGLDGKHVFASTGDIIDAATKKIIVSLTDEFGRPVRSEKIVEVLFRDGKPVKVSDQFGYGHRRGPAPD